MDDSTHASRFTAEQLATLALPPARNPAARDVILRVEELLGRDEIPASELAEAWERHNAEVVKGFPTRGGSFTFDQVPWIAWPNWLYIPRGADSHQYWVSAAPAGHRYALAWTAPPSNTSNKASAADGKLFTTAQLPAEAPASDPSSESGVGIVYSPTPSLSVVEFAPDVDMRGTLRTALEFFPTLAAGGVEVHAEVLLCAWHVIPGGFDLLRFTSRTVTSTGLRDQSHGAARHQFADSFSGGALSASFLVQRGHTYLFGVVCRVTVTSSLTSNSGGPLTGVPNSQLVVYGSVNTDVPQMSLRTSIVYIP
jgi:hypothetical protein